MGAVGEGGCDAEGLAGAADGPEEIFVLGGTGGDDAAGGEDHFDGEEVVDCEAVFSAEPAVASTQSETPNPGVVDSASNSSETVFPCCGINVCPYTASLGGDCLRFCVYRNGPH